MAAERDFRDDLLAKTDGDPELVYERAALIALPESLRLALHPDSVDVVSGRRLNAWTTTEENETRDNEATTRAKMRAAVGVVDAFLDRISVEELLDEVRRVAANAKRLGDLSRRISPKR